MNYADKPVVIVATGPSLSEHQCEIVRVLKDGGLIYVTVVNNAYERVPNADALVAADQPWWMAHKDRVTKACPNIARWTCDGRGREFGAQVFPVSHGVGIAKDGEGIRRGSSSGFMAIGLAIRWGAKHICLIGFDGKKAADGRVHYFGDHKEKNLNRHAPLQKFAEEYDTLAGPCEERGIRLVNCSIDTATQLLMRGSLCGELLC